MFFRAVEENEIMDIANIFKNKISADLNGIDTTKVNDVIKGIAKPLTHICNLSFQRSQMKMAKVIPLYKTGDRKHFTNYRPVSLLYQFYKI